MSWRSRQRSKGRKTTPEARFRTVASIQKSSQTPLRLDLHGHRAAEVEGLILHAISRALELDRELEVVHGHHHGTTMKTTTLQVLGRLKAQGGYSIANYSAGAGSTLVRFR